MENEHTSSHGFRLLPTVVDDYATNTPEKVHSYVYPSGRLQDGIAPVTFKTLARAVNRAARWLMDDVKIAHKPVAFLGCSDPRNIIFFLACIKTSSTIVMLNCYTPEQETSRLLDEYGCKVLLYTEYSGDHVPSGAIARRVPELKVLLSDEVVEHVEYSRKYNDVKSDLIAIVLTSGSTGRPKGVRITHERLSALDATQDIEPHHGRPVLKYVKTLKSTLKYVALDLAYMGGIDIGVVCPIFEGQPVVIGPGSIIPHELVPEQFVAIMRHSRADSFLSYPNVLEQLLGSIEASKLLYKLEDVGYIGGPLNDICRERLSQHTFVSPYIGSTETGSFITHQLPRSLSGYICLNSTKMGMSWEHVDDDLYEPVFRRQNAVAIYQSVFHSFPERDVWRMGDLYSKHETEMDVWRYEGRKDDTIILNHGENIAPVALERQLQGCPAVEHAMLVGNARSALALLIKVRDTYQNGSDDDCFRSIWPSVDGVNKAVGPLAKIQKSHVLLIKDDKPFVLTKKGATSRKAMLKLYSREIDALYSN